jgi:CheY-like chemotaxis protein
VLNRITVDAIISDILMPRMDGYRLCHEVRKNANFDAVPFIVLHRNLLFPQR